MTTQPENVPAGLSRVARTRDPDTRLATPPRQRGVLHSEIQVLEDLAGRYRLIGDLIHSNGFDNLGVADATMGDIKRLQEQHTQILNQLSSIRKEVAAQLSEMRRVAAIARRSEQKK